MSTKKLQILGNFGSGIGIDDTLTQPGLAADAKATGDQIDNLETQIDEMHTLIGDAAVANQIATAISTKAEASELETHTSNTSNPHGVTKGQIGLGSVEDKSSEIIRGEITAENVTNALGYAPAATDLATGTTDGLMSSGDKVKLDGLNIVYSSTEPENPTQGMIWLQP